MVLLVAMVLLITANTINADTERLITSPAEVDYIQPTEQTSSTTCGGAVQCSCGDTLSESQTMWYDLVECTGHGLLISSDNITLDCNEHVISGNLNGIDYGISIENKDNNTITNCNVNGFYRGIYASGIRDTLLFKNNVNNNIYDGIVLVDSFNNNVSYNNVSHSLGQTGIFLTSGSTYNNITDNILNNNFHGGIHLHFISKWNVVKNNIVKGNKYGLIVGGASANSNTITKNAFIGNTLYGVYIEYARYNTFSNNFFVNNTINAMEFTGVSGNKWNLSTVGNYWHDFESNPGYPYTYDIPGPADGIDYHPVGNVPHNIPPHLESFTDIWVLEKEDVVIEPNASDLDGDILTFSINDDRFVWNDVLEQFSWTTNETDSGNYTFTVTVSDGVLEDSEDINVEVKDSCKFVTTKVNNYVCYYRLPEGEPTVIIATLCGDGITQPALGEFCDDGNLDYNDMCTPECMLTICGDGIKQTPNGYGTNGPLDDGFEECDGFDGVGPIQECTVNCELIDLDDQAPIIEKEHIGPFSHDENEELGEFHWITQETEIVLSCYDDEPNPTEVTLGWRIWDDVSDEWTEWFLSTGWEVIEVVSFGEDSVHKLQYYCVDMVGNSEGTIETPHEQAYRVDSTPPETTKVYGTPHYPENINDDPDYPHYISLETPITLTAVDPDPTSFSCNIGVDKTWYRNDWWGEGEGTTGCYEPDIFCNFEWYGFNSPYSQGSGCIDLFQEWCTEEMGYAYGTPEWYVCVEDGVHIECSVDEGWQLHVPGTPIENEDESCHVLQYFSVDHLGNIEESNINCFFVDDTPPESWKWYEGPQYPIEGYPKWVTSETQIYLDAEDEKVGVDEIYWRNLWFPDNNEICYQDPIDCASADPNSENCFTDTTQTVCNPDYYNQFIETDVIAWNIYTGPFKKNEESCHVIEYYAVDDLGNEETLNWQCVFVDDTPPIIEKVYDGHYFEEQGVEWINSDTQIYFDIYDDEPHPSGIEEVNYRVSLVEDESCWDFSICEETSGNGDWTSLETDYFNINEESCHLIEVEAIDNVDKVSNHKQCVFVDNTAPTLVKTHDEDAIADFDNELGDFHWMTTDMEIELYCVDADPYPTEVTLYWRIWDDVSGEWSDWYSSTELEVIETIYFEEDSVHKLQYFCEDMVGNTEGTVENPHEQIYRVDTVPPSITKSLVGPYEGDCPPEPGTDDVCYIKAGETEIHVEVTDGGDVCHVDSGYCYYWYFWDGQRFPSSGVYGLDEDPIIFTEDSEHELHIVCKDELRNTMEEDIEIFYVDGEYQW